MALVKRKVEEVQSTVVYKAKVTGTIQEIMAWIRLKMQYERERGM